MSALGQSGIVATAPWPKVDPAALTQAAVEWIIQVNGKLRAKLSLPVGSPNEVVERAALADENIRRFMADKPARKVIVVPNKLVNIVV